MAYPFGPRPNYLNNSQNHLKSVNRLSVILQFCILQRLAKQKLSKHFERGSISVIDYLMNCRNKWTVFIRGAYWGCSNIDGDTQWLTQGKLNTIVPMISTSPYNQI